MKPIKELTSGESIARNILTHPSPKINVGKPDPTVKDININVLPRAVRVVVARIHLSGALTHTGES